MPETGPTVDVAIRDAAEALRVVPAPSPASAGAGVALTPSTSPGVGPEDLDRLDRGLVSGLAWTALAKWANQLLTWGSTVVVARLLTPEDYGLMGMAGIYMGLAALVAEFGLGSAVVQRRDLTEDQLARIGGLAIGTGAVLAVLTILVAQPIASFFGEDSLRLVIVALSPMMIFAGLQVLPLGLLRRDLRFRSLARVDTGSIVCTVVVVITLAVAGLGYWALVAGLLAGRASSALLAIAACRHRQAWPARLHELLPAIRFGSHMMAGSVAWYAYSSFDALVVGKRLGSSALGAYTMATSIAMAPINQVTQLISRVAPSIISAVADDAAAVRRYILRISEAQAFVVFPAAVGLALVADSLVVGLIGAKWMEAVNPMRVLAFGATLRCLGPLLAQVVIFTGHPEQNTRINLISAVVFPLAFLIGSSWGPTGVAIASVLAFFLVEFPLFLHYASRAADLSPRTYFAALGPATLCTFAMVVGVLGIRTVLSEPATLPGLFVQAGVGAVVYLAAVGGLYGERARGAFSTIRKLRSS